MTLRAASTAFLTEAQVRAADNCGCVTLETPTSAVLLALIDHASDIIAMMTGFRASGRRQWIARPCRTGMSAGCFCCGLDGIPLGDRNPVVDQVKVDGVVLDPSEYELHSTLIGYSLVRTSPDNITHPLPWPSSQPRWKADTEDGTFSITFTEGIHIDNHTIESAAMELVCDMISQDVTAANELASGIISAQLGGTTVTVDPNRLERAKMGELGPAFVKMLGLYAPGGRMTSTVWAPELDEGWDLFLQIP